MSPLMIKKCHLMKSETNLPASMAGDSRDAMG